MTAASFAGRRVMVTGARGFLGAHLTRRLEGVGAQVFPVSRSAPSDASWRQADLRDYSAVTGLLASVQPDVVFHLSGHVTATPALDAVLPTFESLTTSTVNLLTAVTLRPSTRLVLAGSLVEPEDGTASPGSPYAAAKWAASMYGRLFQTLYKAPVVVAQLAYSYGPGQAPGRLIPYVIESLLRGEAPKLTSGDLRADWIYVDDMIDGLLVAGAVDRAVGRVVDLGSGTLVPVHEVVRSLVRLADATVEPLFGARPDRPLERFRPAAAAKARDLIGWHASTGLEQGLRRTVDWHRGRRPERCT